MKKRGKTFLNFYELYAINFIVFKVFDIILNIPFMYIHLHCLNKYHYLKMW